MNGYMAVQRLGMVLRIEGVIILLARCAVWPSLPLFHFLSLSIST